MNQSNNNPYPNEEHFTLFFAMFFLDWLLFLLHGRHARRLYVPVFSNFRSDLNEFRAERCTQKTIAATLGRVVDIGRSCFYFVLENFITLRLQ
jgi:hypothetical protein